MENDCVVVQCVQFVMYYRRRVVAAPILLLLYSLLNLLLPFHHSLLCVLRRRRRLGTHWPIEREGGRERFHATFSLILLPFAAYALCIWVACNLCSQYGMAGLQSLYFPLSDLPTSCCKFCSFFIALRWGVWAESGENPLRSARLPSPHVASHHFQIAAVVAVFFSL